LLLRDAVFKMIAFRNERSFSARGYLIEGLDSYFKEIASIPGQNYMLSVHCGLQGIDKMSSGTAK